MGFVEQIFAAAARAGLLKTAVWQPADGSAPQTQAVGFSAPDTTLLDGLALGTDLEMSFPASAFVGIAVRDGVVIDGIAFQVRDLRAVGDGSERRARLSRL
ncbi:head-tail joining protein [Aquimonas voraii]|jgi:hypothetical protein|uniref:Uncharacterized protein n=1 Tax=Aquimonas voraii TaxID=265719 RepID=A0A1G6T1N6_9GAMM|nr:hypothetical protein [Aquimonas voraii]SDD22901.1 hypothetical protein SAMN04488509_101829 [Aquimonas voraii]